MKRQEQAILVVSFGTSYHETREKTIDKLEKDLQAAFPERKLYRAWTSKMIIKKILKRDGVKIHTVTEAMETMLADGIRDVLIQPTHILGGVENDLMTADAMAFADRFDSIVIGDPLLIETEDFFATIDAIAAEYDIPDHEGLVLMGHGTTHQTNAVYAALDYMFKDAGHENYFMGTVEAYPEFETMLKLLKKSPYRKVTLLPFMIVAGDHANNDMAGDEDDAWKTMLEKEGYEVTCILKGLGEIPGIRRIFTNHAKKAVEAAH